MVPVVMLPVLPTTIIITSTITETLVIIPVMMITTTTDHKNDNEPAPVITPKTKRYNHLLSISPTLPTLFSVLSRLFTTFQKV